MPVTKAQAKKIARKQAGIAADDAIALIVGAASSSLDTFEDVEGELAGFATTSALGNKQDTITGAATTITSDNLTTGRVLVSSSTTGKVAVSDITSTELDFLSGLSGDSIATQLSGKQDTIEDGDLSIEKTNGLQTALNSDYIGNFRALSSGNQNLWFGHKTQVNRTPPCPAVYQGATGVTALFYKADQELVIRREEANRVATFNSNGHLGLGTGTSVICPLHVEGGLNNSHTHAAGRAYFFSGTGGTSAFNHSSTHDTSTTSTNTTIYARYNINAGGYFVAVNGAMQSGSDTRIKTNIVDLEDTACLEQLNQLKPKRYQYKDVVQRGSGSVVGFIAQEVRDVLPSAVDLSAQYIPNIYQLATVNGNVLEFTSSLDLSAIRDGGKIKVYDIQNREHFIDVASASGSTITLADATQIEAEWLEENKIFVYGQEVADFHLLKKEMIIPIAVGAIQELDRRATAQATAQATALETLEARIETLNQFVTNMPFMQLVQDLDARNTALEQQVQKLTERVDSLNAFTATLRSLLRAPTSHHVPQTGGAPASASPGDTPVGDSANSSANAPANAPATPPPSQQPQEPPGSETPQ